MVVQIGINPITWTNDDVPELGGDTPLETCLEETAAAGYAGTELGGKFPRSADALAPILNGFGLALVSGWFDGGILDREVEEEFDRILSHLTLLRDLGCKVVVYADTSAGDMTGSSSPYRSARYFRRMNGRPTGESSHGLPSGWRSSVLPWPSTTIWGRSSRQIVRSTD